MNEPKLAPRILACFAGAVVVVVIAVYVRPATSESIMFGDLADKAGDHSQRSVTVSNAVWGKQHGRYHVIPSPRADRYPVVFVLRSNAPLPNGCTVLQGKCEGISQNPLPNCPAVPPFVLVTDVVPVVNGD